MNKIFQGKTACPAGQSAIGILRDGSRNDGLTRLAGAMRRHGATLAVLETGLLEANDRRCRPALETKEVLKIAASVARYPIGGPDPLEVAWQQVHGETFSSNYERFLALAQQLQLARPGQTIALPLKRIATLMNLFWTRVGCYRQRAERDGILQRVEEYIPHRRATLYRLASNQKELAAPSYPVSLVCVTSGLVTPPNQKPLVTHPTKASSYTAPDPPLVTHPQLAQLLCLAARSFKVFLCQPRTKVPMFKGWQEQASSDPATITGWFDKFPEANWAIRTGRESGVVVLDVDGEAGLESLYGLGEQARQIETLGVRTPGWKGERGGSHLYFQWPAGRLIRNSVGKLGAGLDIRGAGGYVLVPPSVNENGVAYEFLGEDGENKPVASAPDWLLELERRTQAR